MAYLWAGPATHVAFVHYVAGPIPHLHHYLLFNAKQGVGWHAHVAFVYTALAGSCASTPLDFI